MGNSNRGFILTSDLREISGQTCLEFWLSSPDGPIKVTTTPQQGVFFISQQDAAQAKDILATSQISCQINALALKRFDQQPVSALYFSRAKQVYAAKERLRVHGITCYEADIRLADRYLMERFIYASVDFRGTKQSTAKYPNYTQSQLKPGQYTPSFSVLSIDIECSEKGELYSIGFASSTYQAVFMIGDNQQGPDFIQWVADEKALLQCFIAAIQTQDPDIIIGWNVVNFDFRLLIERAQLYNLKLTLGRGGEAVYWRDAPNEVNQGYISMPGRVVIDGIDALKTATYQFASFSLEFVAQALLGKGKLSDDVDDRLAKIKHDFVHNKVKLAQYNLQDCQLVLEIFEHTKMLDFLTLRSQLTGLELNRVGGSVAAFVNLYLPKLHRAGYISPNRPVDGGLASPGGYVMTSTPGLYRNVLVLDFKSLYPQKKTL